MAGANIGDSGGINAGLGANAGGTGGINAGLGANVGGTSGVGVGVGVGVGIDNVTNPSNPSNVGISPNPSHLNGPRAVAQMSSSQLRRMKKRCVDVLGSEGTYDRDLRQLCLLIARR
ncbi:MULTISPECIES: hypothetical protein [unclassified Mesorhizobium]|uniref:hypothetical protein n=1 Tax=unclassified Mesorhizobium TaxID=325217 RepID=UPI001FEEA375|nr:MULTISPECIES: hypothetical protein [unclassified Mesorhizobium]